MKCDQLTRTKYAPVMGTIIRRRNEDLIAINSSAVSHTSNACLESPREMSPEWYERIQPVPNKEARRILLARTTSLRSMGRCPGRCPMGATADEYGQTGLKWPE